MRTAERAVRGSTLPGNAYARLSDYFGAYPMRDTRITGYSPKIMPTFRARIICLAMASTAVLAAAAPVPADVRRREVAVEVPLSLGLANGQTRPCAISAWSGVGLEGSCGLFRWEQLAPGTVLQALKAVVPANDADSTVDALAILLAHPQSTRLAGPGKDWAKRQGVDEAGLTRARTKAEELRTERAALLEAERSRAALGSTPELAAFPTTPWRTPTPERFAEESAALIEHARALLARAGGSATLYESDRVAILSERSDAAVAGDAAWLDARVGEWSDRFARVGAAPSMQAKVVVIQLSDQDRYRHIVASGFEGGAARHPDSVTIYPTLSNPVVAGDRAALVIVAPTFDRTRARHAAALGSARALLHYTTSAARPPAFLNEGMPAVLADVAVPGAGVDARLRGSALQEVRNGHSLVAVTRAKYADTVWLENQETTAALSYLFVRWLWDNEPGRLMRLVKGDGGWGPTEELEARFEKAMGVKLDASCRRATQWFRTND